jgi:hypothetical protein
MKANSPEAEYFTQVLSAQIINHDGPGSIVRDVGTIIEFIGEKGVVTSSKLGNLPVEPLIALNAKLAMPIDIPLKRPLLTSYPNISGIYILLRVMAMVRVEGKLVKLDRGALALWRRLNPTEQYFALLEAWLGHAEAKVVGEDAPRWFSQHYCVSRFLRQFKSMNWKKFDETAHLLFAPESISKWNAVLMKQFGLIDVEALPLEGRMRQGHGHGWMLGKARITPWGSAVTNLLVKSFPTNNFELVASEAPDFGDLVEAFSPYFPELEKAFELVIPDGVDGTYVFKASFDLGRAPFVSCLLGVPGDLPLANLADAILAAFSFEDTEHMYNFSYRDQLGKPMEAHCCHSEEGPWADEISVSETGLPLKGIMRFLFDYGASWVFALQLMRIDPPGDKDANIQLIKLTGTPPKQYPDW